MTVTDITFSNERSCRAGEVWQDINYNGQVIGALKSKIQGLLNPVQETFQVLVSKTESDKLESWYESEEEGKIFACFDSIEKFIKFTRMQHGGY